MCNATSYIYIYVVAPKKKVSVGGTEYLTMSCKSYRQTVFSSHSTFKNDENLFIHSPKDPAPNSTMNEIFKC